MKVGVNWWRWRQIGEGGCELVKVKATWWRQRQIGEGGGKLVKVEANWWGCRQTGEGRCELVKVEVNLLFFWRWTQRGVKGLTCNGVKLPNTLIIFFLWLYSWYLKAWSSFTFPWDHFPYSFVCINSNRLFNMWQAYDSFQLMLIPLNTFYYVCIILLWDM